MTTLGETATVSAIGADDLARYYRRALDPSRLVITVVGDILTDGIIERLSDALSGLRGSSAPFEMPPAPAVTNTPRYAERTIDRKQSHVVLGYQSVTVHDPDRRWASASRASMQARRGEPLVQVHAFGAGPKALVLEYHQFFFVEASKRQAVQLPTPEVSIYNQARLID